MQNEPNYLYIKLLIHRALSFLNYHSAQLKNDYLNAEAVTI